MDEERRSFYHILTLNSSVVKFFAVSVKSVTMINMKVVNMQYLKFLYSFFFVCNGIYNYVTPCYI